MFGVLCAWRQTEFGMCQEKVVLCDACVNLQKERGVYVLPNRRAFESG